MILTQAQKALLERAKAQRIYAAAGYRSAWLRDPTARGYAAVDRALDRLELAEHMERQAELGLLDLDAFETKAAA